MDAIHIRFNCNQLETTAKHKKRLHNPAEHACCGFNSRHLHQDKQPLTCEDTGQRLFPIALHPHLIHTSLMTSITLPEFLRARFAEDEAVARAADGPVWDSGDGNISEGGLYANDWSITWFDLGETNPEQRISGANWKRHAQENADHAARHDPARVLAECEAKRRIVELHDSWPTLVETPIETETTNDIDGYVLRASKQINWLTTREYVARFGIEPPTAPILALLALPYADHEDYRPEWKP